MERKNLEQYLSKSNFELLADFKWGIQGQNDFGQFMNLIREQQKEIERLNNELEEVTEDRNTWRSNSLDWEGEEDEDDDYETICCSECGEDKKVEKGTWALDKGMCEQCYCAYQGG